MKSILLIFSFLLVVFIAEGKEREKPRVFLIDRNIKYQTIDNFGASDAWKTQFVGRYWPIEKRNKIADLLFSLEDDSAQTPIGIGLSNWRVNLGAGSYENRVQSEVQQEWNKTECFLSADGTYDFTKQAGQQWMMEAARKRGVDDFLLFTNSAPYFMTRSGATLAMDGKKINLRDNMVDEFAAYMAASAKYFIDKGFNIRYISPINEPQIDWSENKGQEGSFASNEDGYRVVAALSKAIDEKKISSKIVFGEACDMKYLFDADTSKLMPDNLIEEFISKNGKFRITNLPNVYNAISAHDYWSAFPVKTLVDTRAKIAEVLTKADPQTKFWASEYCILEKNDDLTGETAELKSINLGLYIARIIHADLALASAAAWQWWTAMSFAEDVPIIIKPCRDCGRESLKYDGDIVPTKMLWATGNFSRFIRPGMWRISIEEPESKLTVEDRATGLMSSAYSDGEKTVVVFVNYSHEPSLVNLKSDKSKIGKVYRTSINEDLKFVGERALNTLSIAERSIVTVVF